MAKYIDADALIKQRPENLNNRCENYDKAVYASGWNDCNECWCDMIDKMPAADVEPVVDWISTDEGLPIVGQTVLCYTRFRSYAILTYEQLATDKKPTFRPGNYVPGKDVKYWTTLPEPPKMDGGSE